jgi:hypothetical protein
MPRVLAEDFGGPNQLVRPAPRSTGMASGALAAVRAPAKLSVAMTTSSGRSRALGRGIPVFGEAVLGPDTLLVHAISAVASN